jgi:hypothetical protein
MALTADLGVARTTSSLHEVANDTGRTAYCGPYVLSAITGFPVSRVEEEIRRLRGVGPESGTLVKGTHTEEVAATLAHFGYRMEPVANFMDLERKARPSLWTWMQKPRNAWTHYILAVHKGKEGHWVLVKGVKLCDTYSGGKWQFVCDGPHKSAKIMEVFEVRRHLLPGAAGAGLGMLGEDGARGESRAAVLAA